MDRTAQGAQHEIWVRQCEAARFINRQYGTVSAFDYLVGEKLLNFAKAAEDNPAFEQALPQFISEIRRIFTHDAIEKHLVRIERQRLERAMDAMDVYDPVLDDIAAQESEARCFDRVKELLTSPVPGTS